LVAVLKGYELLKIFSHLEGLMTPEDLAWLRKTSPGFWENYPDNAWKEKDEKWKKHFLSNCYGVSFLIQTMIDAKMRAYPRVDMSGNKSREDAELRYANGMPKKFLMELAEILEIDGFQYAHQYRDCNENAFSIARKIMEKII
jgi:hypothetical protein